MTEERGKKMTESKYFNTTFIFFKSFEITIAIPHSFVY